MAKKIKLFSCLILICVILGGCQLIFPLASCEESTLLVEKSGKIKELIVESFSDENYSEEALNSYVDSMVSDYNRTVGSDVVETKKLDIKDGTARMELNYESAQHYAEFNQLNLQILSGETYVIPEGVSFVDVDGNPIILPEQGLDGYNVLALDFTVQLILPKDIAYISSNVELTDKKRVKTGVGTSVVFYAK